MCPCHWQQQYWDIFLILTTWNWKILKDFPGSNWRVVRACPVGGGWTMRGHQPRQDEDSCHQGGPTATGRKSGRWRWVIKLLYANLKIISTLFVISLIDQELAWEAERLVTINHKLDLNRNIGLLLVLCDRSYSVCDDTQHCRLISTSPAPRPSSRVEWRAQSNKPW